MKKVESINFETSAIPTGGVIKIDPANGIIGDTDFTLNISNW